MNGLHSLWFREYAINKTHDEGMGQMEYISLTKALYSDATPERFDNVRALHATRLESESTFRTGITISGDELFLAVPRELSLLNEKVLRREQRIATHMRAIPAVAQWALVRGLVVDEVVSTNSLEGVYSTRRQINELLQADGSDRDSYGQKRFRELAKLYLGLYCDDPKMPSTAEDVRAIYDKVMEGEPLDDDHRPDGRLFRADGVDVYAPNGRVVHQGIEPESRIIDTINTMLSIVNSEEIPATYSAIMGHFIFEYTHPFYDGNGRTGRYLLALHLSRPFSILTSLSLSRVLAENRTSYYRAFRQTEHPTNHGELTPFVISILESVMIAQKELDVELDRKQATYELAIEKLADNQNTNSLNDREMRIVFFLTQLQLFAAFPDATLAEIADDMELSTQQARVHTKRLENKGLIVTTNRRPLRFALSDHALAEIGIPRDQG